MIKSPFLFIVKYRLTYDFQHLLEERDLLITQIFGGPIKCPDWNTREQELLNRDRQSDYENHFSP